MSSFGRGFLGGAADAVVGRLPFRVDRLGARFAHPARVKQAQRYVDERRGDGIALVCGAEEVLRRSYGDDAGSRYRYDVVAPDGCVHRDRRLARGEEERFLSAAAVAPERIGDRHFVAIDARRAGAIWRFSWDDPEALARDDLARSDR